MPSTKEQNKRYREKHRDRLKEKAKRYREENKDRLKETKKKWREANKEKIKEINKKAREKDIIANRERIKKWRLENPEKYQSQYKRKHIKRANDPKERLDHAISSGILFHLKLKGLGKEKKSWKEILGYTLLELVEHLEKKFTPEMAWDNYGEYWHVDHVIPKSWFQYTSIDDEKFKECWALENLQPLTATENCSKGNRYAGRIPAEEKKNGEGQDQQENLCLGGTKACRTEEAGGGVEDDP